MKFPEFCIRRPITTIVMSLILIVIGIVSMLRIPISGYPKIDPPMISVTTNYPGASPSVIESQITTPIENELVGLNGLDTMSSKSQQAKSQINLRFNLGVHINDALNDVRNQLAKINQQLPNDVQAPIIQKRDTDNLQTLIISLSGKNFSTLQLTDLAQRDLVDKIGQIDGVAQVEIYNERDYSMDISLDPARMAADGVTVDDLANILNQQNVNVPAGQITNADRNYSVYSRGELSSANDFQHLIIRNQNGYWLRFSDIADVRVGAENTQTAMRVDGQSAVGIGIYAQADANPMAVAARIQHFLPQLQTILPTNVHLNVAWDNTAFLKASLNKVYLDLFLAVGLVIVVVFLFLGNVRATLIPIVTIPVCLIGIFALMYGLGYSLNLFTLLALVLAIGLVVDDAIVMLENIHRHLEQGHSPIEAAKLGSKEIAFAIVAMTLTLAAVYAPIGFAGGMTGVVFQQFAFTLALVVILSGFVALSLSPMMCSRLLKSHNSAQPLKNYSYWLHNNFERLVQGYRYLLQKLLKRRVLVIIVLSMIFGIGYYCFSNLPFNLAPQEDMGAFMLSISPPANASYDYVNRDAKLIENKMAQLPGVKHVMMIVNNDATASAFIILQPWEKRKLSAQQLMERARKILKQIPGEHVGVFNLSHLGGGGKYGDSLRFSVVSDQGYADLYQTVEALKIQLSKIPGLADIQDELQPNTKQYAIHVRHDLAAAMNVSEASITNTLKVMLGGEKITAFNWQGRDYDVLLQLPQQDISHLEKINQLYVRNATGQMVALGNLVDIDQDITSPVLQHQDRLPEDTITAQIQSGYAMSSLIDSVKQVMKQNLPNGYNYSFQGVAKELIKSHGTMIGIFSLALIFIYLVLAAQFESFIDPLIILLTVPLSMVGALMTLKLVGLEMSIYTNIGLVTLIGLISKHGILITEFANQRREQGIEFTTALIEAASLRLRPILMTTAAMVFGAIPLAFSTGAGELSRQHIGWVIAGGMLFGTFFSLFVVPVAYSFLGRIRKIL